MSARRCFALLVCVAVALGYGGLVGTAFAASPPPPNDLIGGATVVSALPFTDTVDTTGATTDATDTQANAACGAPLTNNSVWYKFTAGPGDTVLAVDTTGSTFSSGVLIATGTPGALTTVACGPVTSHVGTTPGTTYYIMAFDDTGSGGTLHISMHGPGPVPANDTIWHAAPVTSLHFKATLDTTGATSDAVDTQANKSCGAPTTGNTVWYKLTTKGKPHNIFVDTENSDYEAGVLIATADQGELHTVACGPEFVTATTKKYTDYYIMIFDPYGGGGGNLGLNIGEAPHLAVNVRKFAPVDAHGVVTLAGTYRCSGATNFQVSGSLVEIVGNQVPNGSFGTLSGPTSSNCNGALHPWTGVVASVNKAHFAPGQAAASTSAIACGRIACTFVSATTVVKLTASAAGHTGLATAKKVHTRTVRHSPPRRYEYAMHANAHWGHR